MMQNPKSKISAEVVCFGMLIPSIVMLVDDFPAHNTGALVTRVQEIVEDDAAIIAWILADWQVRSGLIATSLGNDARGKKLQRDLKQRGVLGKIRLTDRFATPYEVDVSDRTGHRTYFWQREKQVLDTLDTTDLSLLRGAKFLYVDWYDGDHILRAMDEAKRLGVQVYLNLEHGHYDPRMLTEYVSRADIVQASTDEAQQAGNPYLIARIILEAGADMALITLASEGCVVATHDQTWRIAAPQIKVIDGCGAGASFSAGFIYGQLHHWSLEKSARFAIAAGSHKCTQLGIDALSLTAIKRLMRGAIIVP